MLKRITSAIGEGFTEARNRGDFVEMDNDDPFYISISKVIGGTTYMYFDPIFKIVKYFKRVD